MAIKCSHCRGTDVGYGFDSYQCFECGGYTLLDGTPTVPTSALAADGTYSGPGAHLIEDPSGPPTRATNYER